MLKTGEERFARTLERSLALLDEELAKLSGDTLDGETAFRCTTPIASRLT
ncbi:hypothetical protein ACLK1T_19780 [Escherichia coli]